MGTEINNTDARVLKIRECLENACDQAEIEGYLFVVLQYKEAIFSLDSIFGSPESEDGMVLSCGCKGVSQVLSGATEAGWRIVASRDDCQMGHGVHEYTAVASLKE